MAVEERKPGEGVHHYEVAYRWQRGDKTGWSNVGSAFPNADGSISVSFNSLLVPGIAANPGDYRLYPKFEPGEKKLKPPLKKKSATDVAALGE